jgi:hypothetical protein
MKPSLALLTAMAAGLLTALPPAASADPEEVNLYSARKEELIKPLLDRFTEQTGIKVNMVTDKAETLLKRLESEGINSRPTCCSPPMPVVCTGPGSWGCWRPCSRIPWSSAYRPVTGIPRDTGSACRCGPVPSSMSVTGSIPPNCRPMLPSRPTLEGPHLHPFLGQYLQPVPGRRHDRHPR